MKTGAGFNYTLKWRTFDSLLSDVRVDFHTYALENLIDPAQLIKVARACNYTLGLRIHATKEILLDLEKGRTRLPDDFYSMNFAMMCGSFTETFALPQGTQIEEVLGIPEYKSTPANINACFAPVVCSNCHLVPCGCSTTVSQTAFSSCSCGCSPCSCPSTNICADAVYSTLEPYGDYWKKPRVFLNCKNECMQLIQTVNTTTRTYNETYPLRLISNAQGIECGCPGLYFRCADEAWIKDGWLYTNFARNSGCGTVYINYQGQMVDDEGNLMVPDHEEINNFYEYALKAKILENLWLNGEDVAQKMALMEERRKVAKGAAKAIVLTPNFREMQTMWNQNRNAQWNKYFGNFSSQPWFDYNAYVGATGNYGGYF